MITISKGVLMFIGAFIVNISAYAQKKDSIAYNKEYFAVYRFDEYQNKYIETPVSTRLKIIGEFDSLYIVKKQGNKNYYTNKFSDIHLHGKYNLLDVEKPTYDEVFYTNKTYNLGDNLITLNLENINPIANSEGYFSKGFKIDKWIIYSSKSCFSKTEEHYKNGVRDGLYTVYDKNDSILYQTQFINGTGIEKIYRSDGSLYHIKHFKNGSIDYSKLYALYYDNGEVAEEFNLKEKTRKSFYKNGNISCLQVDTIKNDKSRNIIAQLRTIIIYDRRGVVRERKYYKDYNWVYTIFYNEKQRIERVESGNVILYFNKKKLKNIKFKN